MLVQAKGVVQKMRLFCVILLLIFCSRQTGVESERYLKQPTIIEALPLTSSSIYLAWKGPINHPGGIRYRIYLSRESKKFKHLNTSLEVGNEAIIEGLEPNVRYDVCVTVEDKHYKVVKSSCDDVVIITTPAQLGHVSKTDRKYLTKDGYYRGCRHYWPLDYETKLRDVKYSRDGRLTGTGTGAYFTGNGRGYLSISNNASVRLGKFLKECLCNSYYCSKSGFSVGFWVKLPIFDNQTKILLGTDEKTLLNTSSMVIYQTTRKNNETEVRYVSAIVFMKKKKWKCNFPIQPGSWFYLVVTWSNHSGLRMYKDSLLMSEQKRPKKKAREIQQVNGKCAVRLSPSTTHGTTLTADYDDVVIWHYELSKRLMYQVFRNSFDPPKIVDFKTNGTSLEVFIEDKYEIYNIKRDFKITWWRSGGDQKEQNFTKDFSFSIHGLLKDSVYIVEVQRRMFVSGLPKQALKVVFSKPTETTCNTILLVPTRPTDFKAREKADTHLMLQWKPPDIVHGEVLGYKISYRVDNFKIPEKWTDTFRTDVNTAYLDNLKPFTDYIIKVSCKNEYGIGKAVTLRSTTDEGVPDPPTMFRVKLKGEVIVAKWRQPKELNGLVNYKIQALVNGTATVICNECGESYRLEDVDQFTTYALWVIAYNIRYKRFESQPSNMDNLTTPSYTPSSPRNLTASFTRSGIYVKWVRSKEPRGRIEYKLLGFVNGSKRVFCDECGLHYSVENVAKHTVYVFWAVAYNVYKGYESGVTNKVTIDTASYVPTTPGDIRFSILFEGILVSWNKSSVSRGSIRYQLVGLENGVMKLFCSDCGLKFLMNKTEPNMNYSFWAVSYNIQTGYESPPSSVVHFHTARNRPPAPTDIEATNVADTTARITWHRPKDLSKNEEIVGYEVTLYDAFTTLDVKKTKGHQLEFTNLTQFSKYYVKVRVISGAGYGLSSEQLTIFTKDKDECAVKPPCSKHAQCTNSAGSYFCSCQSDYVGDGIHCQALPSEAAIAEFCPEETARNITWKKIYGGQTTKQLCPNGTIGISTRKCLTGNGSRSYWSDPNLSNCVSAWISEVDDKLADRTMNSTAVGDFFLGLLEKNDVKGLYGGDIIKSVDVINQLYNRSENNELHEKQSTPTVAKTLLTNLINVSEKVVSPRNLKVWNDIPKEQRTVLSVKMMNSLDSAILKSARIVNFSSIQNEHINVRYGTVSKFRQRNNMFSSDSDDINSIKLPQQVKKNDAEDHAVAVIKYNTIAEVLSAGDQGLNDEDFVNSAVISVSMDPPLSTPFKQPLEFTLSNRKSGNFHERKCSFFNTSRYAGFWSSNGCEVFNVTESFTVCHCYHMTSFSVLMQVKPAELSHSDELILTWITRVGLSISLVALGLAFLTFMLLPRPCGHKSSSRCFKLCEQGYRPTYLKKVRTSIHANLILSLALGEALFLWGIEKTHHKTTCYTVAVALHYLFLVAFHWMAAEGVILYLVLVKVFQRKSAKKDKKMFMIICWGAPAAIVCIALVVGHEYYLHEKCCWLSVTHGMIWGFVGPALAIIFINIIFLCCTFHVMGKRQSWSKADKSMADKIRYWAKGAAIVTCLLGVTWVFGVFFLNNDSIVAAYVFNICNVFQGLFIFVFHCLLDDKIRQRYYQIFCVETNFESLSPNHSTGTGKKEPQQQSTFNSSLSVFPAKLQDCKAESCPTVAENTTKRKNSSTHSLSSCIDRRLIEIKRDSDTMRPRGMSSIYHDSDENMDNIPDNIMTVKHGSKNSSGKVYYQDEDTNEGVFEEYWISTTSNEDGQEFQEAPQATCEDCLCDIREWEEQQVSRKTNSLHERELKTLKETSLESEQEFLYKETSMDDLREDNTRDKDEEHELLSDECNQNKEEPEKCTSYTSVIPHIVLSDFSKSKTSTSPKCYHSVNVTNMNDANTSGQKSPGSTSV